MFSLTPTPTPVLSNDVIIKLQSTALEDAQDARAPIRAAEFTRKGKHMVS